MSVRVSIWLASIARAERRRRPGARRSSHEPSRRGAILILTALLLVVLIAIVAFAVDLGFVTLTRTQFQVAADAAALAGAGAAIDGPAAAEEEAYKFAGMYEVGGKQITRDQVQIRLGRWDSASRVFTPDLAEQSAIEVTVGGTAPLFFGKILGPQAYDSSAQAVATYAPRDIMLVLDFSASMCFDSQLRSIDALGRAPIEANLARIYATLGSPRFGNMQWAPKYVGSNSTASVKSALGLTKVPYPYPGDSWDNYIDYVKNDSYIARAGYRKYYGYLTWVNYLQSERCGYSQTPDLWKTPEQPVTAVKDAVQLLAAFLQEKSPDDRLGLSLYTAADGTAILENELTHDFEFVSDTARSRQAGHYQPYTNISAGMKTARDEFTNNARRGARKLMVLMTDGQANRPGNENKAKAAALAEARAAADAGIPIVAIALGADADTDLMRKIADITKGAYFVIPGGRSVAEYEEDLKDIFRQVASNRALMLVQ